ncbi:ComEC/Rec2 family competence protein [Nonomuraea glycinis]|nr:ComEC/Rec2 family competence protein [Nonomuraea glycinis]MCA2182995.1 ComEC/Rec2 family competence protein [Nonomuraea glycinis]
MNAPSAAAGVAPIAPSDSSRPKTGAGPPPADPPDGELSDVVVSGRFWPLILPALAAWAGALVLLGCPAAVGATAAALATAGAGSAAWLARPSSGRNVTIAVLICVAATAASIALRVHAVTTGPTAALAARSATVTAEITLTNDPKIRRSTTAYFTRDSVIAEATLESLRTGRQRMAVHTPIVVFANGAEWRDLLPSQRLRVSGRLAAPTSGTLTAAVLLVREPPQILTPPSPIQTVAGAFRQGLRTAADILPPDQRGLLPALVVGDVSRMDRQVNSDLQEAGLSHLNAVSGANLAIVAGAALALSRLAGLPLAPRAAFAALAMLAFAIVARPSPSVLRALLMGLVAAAALGTGRAKDGMAALSATVLLLILFAPELAHSYGFALSVTATAGILLLAARWRTRLTDLHPTTPDRNSSTPATSTADDGNGDNGIRTTVSTPEKMRVTASEQPIGEVRRRWPRLPRWVAEAVAVSAAAQAAVTPVLVLMAGQVSLIAVPANLLAGVAVAPATLLGFVAALIAPFWPEAAQLLVIPAGYAVGWIIMVARWAANVPMANLPWPAGLAGVVLLAVVVAVAVPVMRRRAWRTVTLTVVGAALVAMLVLRPIVAPWPPPGWLMVMCDVGQGDGLVIAAGPQQAVVVDAGPDPSVMDGCLRRIGIRDVPLVILTHPHADHVNGLTGVLRHRRVGAVLTSPYRDPSPQGAHLTADLARRRIPTWTAQPGTRWRFGPSELTVLAPDPANGRTDGQGEGSAANNSSVVIHVRWPTGSALLSGDIESEAQEDLLRGLLPQADILKVPHHGSPRQVPAFFHAVKPRAALVSVGKDNGYGHPAPKTLAALRHLGARTYRTDESGDLAIVTSGTGLAVVARGTEMR